jgi:hypothetical protein
MRKTHRNIAAKMTAEFNILLEDPVSIKYDMSFTNPTSTVEVQMLNLLLVKVMLGCVNDGVTTIKPGYQTTWYGQMSRPSRCSLHQEEFT